jgi:hypothetical protein
MALIDRALAEAEELATSTGFPTLFFPALAEEQVQRVSRFALEDAPPTTRGNLRSIAA